MTPTPDAFTAEIASLRRELVAQGARVQGMVERAIEALFAADGDGATRVVAEDDAVDEADLAIERTAVDMLLRATATGAAFTAADLRRVLTAVKANNELERIADAASMVAERVVALSERREHLPPTTRVITNSVIGIIAEMNVALRDSDPDRAKVVLASEGAVLEFQKMILQHASEATEAGGLDIAVAFDLYEIVTQCVVMADHATNIAEQIIFEATGAVVRHTTGQGWIELPLGRHVPKPDKPAGPESAR